MLSQCKSELINILKIKCCCSDARVAMSLLLGLNAWLGKKRVLDPFLFPFLLIPIPSHSRSFSFPSLLIPVPSHSRSFSFSYLVFPIHSHSQPFLFQSLSCSFSFPSIPILNRSYSSLFPFPPFLFPFLNPFQSLSIPIFLIPIPFQS